MAKAAWRNKPPGGLQTRREARMVRPPDATCLTCHAVTTRTKETRHGYGNVVYCLD